MPSWIIWLCIVLLIGSGVAADVPFVFGEGSSDITDLTSAQLEQVSYSSPDLAGVPSVSTPSDSEVLEFPIVGGGSVPVGKTEKKVDDLKKILSSRVEPDNSTVHEVALLLVAKFPGDLTIDQICSIYSYMKNGEGSVNGWSYARDPRGTDFFMYANQSLKIGGKAGCSGVGDCDDFAILMSALVESIGGTTRIIFAQNKTMGGHAYAEVNLGNLSDQNSQVDEIINWLKQEFNTSKIYTHIDTDTKGIWLNLDWGVDEKGTAHPGGPFYQGNKHIIVCAREQFGKTSLKLSSKKKGFELSPAIPLNITTTEIEGKSAVVWFNKGFALSCLGEYDEAIKAYDEAIGLDPNLAGAWYNKGVALDGLGMNDVAIKAFNEAIRLNPNLAITWWFNTGVALDDLGKYDDAIKAYDEAIRLDPNYAEAWYNKGCALQSQGKHDESIKCFDEAIRLNPNLAIGWHNKGWALGQLGKYDEAIKCFDEAIRLNPNYAEAWTNKGNALGQLGKYDDSIQAFDKAIGLNPNNILAWKNKGVALNALGRTTEADVAFAKAKELMYTG
jgi:tetratricopeptide (TPR) repeat protein